MVYLYQTIRIRVALQKQILWGITQAIQEGTMVGARRAEVVEKGREVEEEGVTIGEFMEVVMGTATRALTVHHSTVMELVVVMMLVMEGNTCELPD